MSTSITIRFYEELNDFLPHNRRKKAFLFKFSGIRSVKDIIEAIGVPHTEVDLILVNYRPVSFDFHPGNDDYISVYPVFESLDISSINRLRPKPLREVRFVLDVHLGTLAKYLRMLGFDSLYRNNFKDEEIIEISLSEQRIILTRDRPLLKNGQVTHGYFVRSIQPRKQLQEVILRFDLKTTIRPFGRCMECNGVIESVKKSEIAGQLYSNTKKFFDEFYRCMDCRKIYWKGSHYERMQRLIKDSL